MSEDSPAAWWRMESSGSGLVDSAGSHNGTFAGTAPTTASSLLPKLSGSSSLSFNGTSQYATVPYAADLNASAFTVEAWIKPSSTTGSGWILQSGRVSSSPFSGYELYRSSGSLNFRVYTSSSSTTVGTSGIVAGRTYHVVGVFDGQNLVLYVNGRTVGTTPATFAAAASESTYVGARGTSPVSGLFAGQLDEVAVYPTALSELRACRHYIAGAAVYGPAALSEYGAEVMADCAIGYWPLNDASGFASDATGIGHPGTPQGTPSYLVEGPFGSGAVGLNGVSGYSIDDAFVVSSSAGSLDGFSFPGRRPYSLEAWIKVSSCPGTLGGIIDEANPSSPYGGYTFRLRNNCRLDFARGGYSQTISPDGSVPIGSWAHVVATYDGSTMRLYVNANLVQSAASTLSDPGGVDVVFGEAKQSNGYRNYFVGSLAHLAIYGRALSSNDVSRHYGAAQEPYVIQKPAIAGFTAQGEALGASNGEWGNDPTSFAFQWVQCDLAGANCTDIFAAGSREYVPSSADVGKLLRLTVTASNASGSRTTQVLTPVVVRPVAELALEYRPAVLFDEDEGWRPLSVDALMGEARDGLRNHQSCVRIVHTGWPDEVNCEPITATSGTIDADGRIPALVNPPEGQAYIDLAQTDGNGSDATSPDPACAAVLDFGDHTTTLKDCDTGTASRIYYHVGQDTNSYRYIDYWWFYRHNDLNGIFLSTDDHEGDWEGVTIRLDPRIDAVNPPVAGVIYAAHSELLWFASDLVGFEPFDGTSRLTHAKVYVAKGSHASYPDACNENSSPYPCGSPSPGDEADHGGEAPWGANSTCVGCVQRLPSHPDSWVYWTGLWGSDTPTDPPLEDPYGAGPGSPGAQTRFDCTEYGWACASRPSGMPLLRAARATGRGSTRLRQTEPTRCATWLNSYTAAVACDARELREAVVKHRMTRRGSFALRVEGRPSGSMPGLAQVLGYPLRAGDRVQFVGRASPRTTLTLQVWAQNRLWKLKVNRLDRSRRSIIEIRHRRGRVVALWRATG